MGYSIGIGLTNDCNLDCAHCYRPTDQVYNLSLDQIKTICDSLPVDAMGMGTGENNLHPQFLEIVDYLCRAGHQADHGLQRLQPEHACPRRRCAPFTTSRSRSILPPNRSRTTFAARATGATCTPPSSAAGSWASRSRSWPP